MVLNVTDVTRNGFITISRFIGTFYKSCPLSSLLALPSPPSSSGAACLDYRFIPAEFEVHVRIVCRAAGNQYGRIEIVGRVYPGQDWHAVIDWFDWSLDGPFPVDPPGLTEEFVLGCLWAGRYLIWSGGSVGRRGAGVRNVARSYRWTPTIFSQYSFPSRAGTRFSATAASQRWRTGSVKRGWGHSSCTLNNGTLARSLMSVMARCCSGLVAVWFCSFQWWQATFQLD